MGAGVILLSEDLHRIAYNAAFEYFQVRPNGQELIAHWCVALLAFQTLREGVES
jgi:hypothetical protein